MAIWETPDKIMPPSCNETNPSGDQLTADTASLFKMGPGRYQLDCYYAQFLGGVFIAALTFIGTFLLSYHGQSAPENRLASIAGLCAISVALFPTNGRGCDEKNFPGRALADFADGGKEAFVTVKHVTKEVSGLKEKSFFELLSGTQYIHGASAALFFAFLA